MKVLSIDGLAERHPGITQSIAGVYCEAASVCFDRHHEAPKVIQLQNGENAAECEITWQPPNAQLKAAYANETDTTEFGAYAVALAAVEECMELVAIHRAETRTGADYYIAPLGSSFEDLEDCMRLEVSGLNKGSAADVLHRLNQKKQQTRQGASNLPAVAAAVGFEVLLVLLSAVSAPE